MLQRLFENIFSDFLRIYHVLPRNLRRSTRYFFALTGLLSIVEILSVFSISFLAMSVVSPERLLAIKPVSALFHLFPWLKSLADDSRFLALVISGTVIVFIAVKNALAALVNVKTHYLKEQVALFVGETVLKHYLYSPYIVHLAGDSQTMLQALSQRTTLGSMFGLLIMIYTYTVITLALFTIAVVVTPWAVLLVLALSTIMAAAIYKTLKGKLDAAGLQQVEYSLEESKCTMNATRGIRENIAYRQQEVFFSAFRKTCLKSVKGNTFLSTAPFMPVWILETMGFAIIPLALWIMYGILDASMVRITGVLTMIMLVAWRVLPMLNRTVAAMLTARSQRHAALNCLERVEEALTTPVSESPDPDPNFALREGIRLARVSFRYPKAETDCLSEIDCYIPCGSRVGIIGTSGAGKSTLALIVSGMAQPSGGAMLVDGKALSPEALAAYCLKVGYVSQSPYLMPGTLAENVAFSQWGKPWDEEKIRSVCRMAKLDVVETRGLSMGIGENGAGLSGGQTQRLSIARALYVNPSVLILDEATSALDGGVENAIMDTIFALPQSITTVIIAHRLSTVERCDTLLWFERGRLIASGPPDDLLPRYQEYLNKIREY